MSRLALRLIGVGLALWMLWRVDTHAVGVALVSMSPWWVVAASLAMSTNIFLKAARWRRMLLVQGIELTPRRLVHVFLESAFFGSLTIGRVGELIRVRRLTEIGVAFPRALASSIFDRVLDLFVLLLVGAAALAKLLGDVRAASGVAIAALAGAAFTVVFVRRWSRRGRPVGGHGKLNKALRSLDEMVRESDALSRPSALVESAAWTLVAWVGYFATVWLLAYGLGLSPPLDVVTGATALAALSTLLPISYQGLGTRELVFTTLLGGVGIASEPALALSLLSFVVFSGTTLLLGAAALFLGAPSSASSRPEEASHV